LNSVSNIFRIYIWLIDLINREGHISLEEINRRWLTTQMSGGVELHRNTFKRYLNSIEELFDINIEYDPHCRSYYLAEKRALSQGSLKRWMLSTMTVAGVVRESRNLQNRIVLENVPSGELLLMEITRAMEEGRTLHIRYQKFVDAQPYDCEVEPYCLKLFRQRWYLLAHRLDRSYLAMYSLDRMTMAEETQHTFVIPQDFDPQMHFADMFGVFQPTPAETARRIVIRAYDGEWKYLQTLPLHHSQRQITHHAPTQLHPQIISNDNPSESLPEYVDFQYILCPTLDFKLELLSRGDKVEVISPPDLREDIAEMLRKAISRYSTAVRDTL